MGSTILMRLDGESWFSVLAEAKRPSLRICPGNGSTDRTLRGSLLAFMTAKREPSNQGFELTGRRFALRAVASFCDWSLRAARPSLQSQGRSPTYFRRGGWGPATGVLSKELGYLSGVPGRLSDGFVTFLFSVGRARRRDGSST